MIRLVRSNPFRVALAFAACLTLTTYVVFAIMYVEFYTSNVALVRSVLVGETRHALEIPADQLRAQLARRLTQDLRRLDFVELFSAKGAPLFGNAAEFASVPPDGQPHYVYAPPPGSSSTVRERAIVVARRRPDGDVLLIGRSLVYVDEFLRTMLRVFTETVAPVALLALLIGVLVSVRASRRLSVINDAIGRVMAGDLHIRLPSGRSDDDIDEVIRAVNRMLDEIGRLIGQIRAVGENIAHDLRAPLAVMRARLERGLTDRSRASLPQLVELSLGDLDRAMTTVTALLRIADLESNLRRGRFEPVDLAAICRDAAELYEPLAVAKGLGFEARYENAASIPGDADLLREALMNLVDNAIKFTPFGGHVTISCGHGLDLLQVRDTGSGISEHERTMILERSYRSIAAREKNGFGLGLNIVATIVDLHGLTLAIEDAQPGTIFSIRARSRSIAGPSTSLKPAASDSLKATFAGQAKEREAACRRP